MCGIAGFYKFPVKDNQTNILKCLEERGPDDNGFWVDNDISLFQTRLSIIDVGKSGHQPMKSFDNRYIIVFNGEIYNHEEIKSELISKNYFFKTNSDTEVLLNAFHNWGKDCLVKLRGMFAFCIWDTLYKTLFIARDRLGIKPILYFHSQTGFAFSSNLKTLLQNIKYNFEIRGDSVDDLFTRGSVSQPYTIVKEIYSLSPGTFLIINESNELFSEKYWDLEDEMNSNSEIYKNISYESALLLNKNVLNESIKYHLVSDVEVGTFLSGGIDSAIVTKLISDNTFQKKIKTFSLGYSSTRNNVDELNSSRKTAAYFNSEHYERIISGKDVFDNFENFIKQLDQPSSDGLNTYFVSQLASKLVKVTMSGLGADEIYSGYNFFKPRTKIFAPQFSKVFQKIYNITSNRYSKYLYESSLNDFEFYSNLRNLSNKKNSILFSNSFNFQIDLNNKVKPFLNIIKNHTNDYIRDTTIIECKRYLLDTLLRDSDATSMAHSLELRPLFLDHKVVEFATSISSSFKIKENNTKSILKDTFKEDLPHHIFNQPKRGFNLPIEEWIEKDLSSLFLDLSTNSGLFKYFNYKFLKKMFDINSKYNPQTKWMFLVFSYWLKQNKFI